MSKEELKQMKRFQECNWLVKGWRYRHYLYIPFKWLYYKYVKPFNVTDDQTLEQDRVEAIKFRPLIKEYGFKKVIKALFKGDLTCNLWRLLTGIAQHDMKWYWTHEEVRAKLLGNMMADDEEDGLYDIDEETVEFYESPEVQDNDVIDDVDDT